jgi:hypothetical protein
MKGLNKSRTRDRSLPLAREKRIHGFSKYLKFSVFSDSAAWPVLFGRYCMETKQYPEVQLDLGRRVLTLDLIK